MTDSASPTAIAVVVCPPWCDISKDQHIADLADWDGRLVHSAVFSTIMETEALDRFTMVAGQTTHPDGTPDDDDLDGLVNLNIEGRPYTLPEALSVAETINATAYDLLYDPKAEPPVTVLEVFGEQGLSDVRVAWFDSVTEGRALCIATSRDAITIGDHDYAPSVVRSIILELTQALRTFGEVDR